MDIGTGGRTWRMAAGLALAGVLAACVGGGGTGAAPTGAPAREASPAPASPAGRAGAAPDEPSPPASPAAPSPPAPSPPAPAVVGVGQPYGTAVDGLLTFRGNPTRTLYGAGPVPDAPEVAWRYPAGGSLCGESTVGAETRQWCGTGWTGQPSVFERDGRTWVVFGAYDHDVHFVDGATGAAIIPPFPTGDIIKGSVTVDPDGHPLVYTGSRDNRFRVLSFDGPEPVELWALEAADTAPTLWNDDWDGSAIVLDDLLFIGGENSRFHVVRLHRGYGPDGRVTVAPELLFDAAGWDDELLAAIGDRNVSIESSVAVAGDVVYFANSGGLVQGWDVAGVGDGVEPSRVFRFWTGDDTDASVVVDEDGMLYVASEYERGNARAREVGQVMKLDPSRPDDPLVWSVADHGAAVAGAWATPALHGDTLYAPLTGGRLLALDRATGAQRWSLTLPDHLWSSPVVVDDVLLQGDCAGVLHAYDVSGTGGPPPERWSLAVEGCIESTPAVWDGTIYVGTRAGQMLAIRDPG